MHPHCTGCHVLTNKDEVYMVSAYFQDSDNINVHLEHFEMVVDSLKGKKIGVGQNALSPMLWYSKPSQTVTEGGLGPKGPAR